MKNEQKEKLKKFIPLFKEYSKTGECLADIEMRKEREAYFSTLTKEKIMKMGDFEFGELVSNLWASRIWTNKDYLVGKIVSQNKIENIRKELAELLYGGDSIEIRFDRFLKNIKGMGPASVTEILCFKDPGKYGIWNDKARKALRILGWADKLPLNKYSISGKEYQKFNSVLGLISNELKNEGFKSSDLLFVDYFLYEVWSTGDIEAEAKLETIEAQIYDFDHNEIRDHVGEIGTQLGFEADTEKQISHGAKVDTIWKAQIANLGVVNYVFEIHKRGSIDSLILNLQKAKRNPSVQKVIAVSDKKQLEKIKKEAEGLDPDFKKALSFWDVADVEKTYERLSEVTKSIGKLRLVRSEFGSTDEDEK